MFEVNLNLTLIYSVVFINSLNVMEHYVSGTVVSTEIRVQSQTQCLLSGKWQSNDTQANAGVERRQEVICLSFLSVFGQQQGVRWIQIQILNSFICSFIQSVNKYILKSPLSHGSDFVHTEAERTDKNVCSPRAQ